MTAQNEINAWIERGKNQGATHLIVVCDGFSYEDYPVFVKPTDELDEIRRQYNSQQNMSRVMEVIKLYESVNKMRKFKAIKYVRGGHGIEKVFEFTEDWEDESIDEAIRNWAEYEEPSGSNYGFRVTWEEIKKGEK